MSGFTEVKHETCYACGKEIVERDAPPLSGNFQKVGKYTIRRQAWDENWKEITEDTYFHEECYYHGFIMAVKHGYLTWQQKEAYKNLYINESFRSDSGVDHS